MFIAVDSDRQKFDFVFFVFVGKQEVNGANGSFRGDCVPRNWGQGELLPLCFVRCCLVGVENNFLKILFIKKNVLLIQHNTNRHTKNVSKSLIGTYYLFFSFNKNTLKQST
jgi:hypothetical protein